MCCTATRRLSFVCPQSVQRSVLSLWPVRLFFEWPLTRNEGDRPASQPGSPLAKPLQSFARRIRLRPFIIQQSTYRRFHKSSVALAGPGERPAAVPELLPTLPEPRRPSTDEQGPHGIGGRTQPTSALCPCEAPAGGKAGLGDVYGPTDTWTTPARNRTDSPPKRRTLLRTSLL